MRLSEELSRGLVEVAAKPGEKRERKDGYTWEKQRDGTWKRLGKTKDLKAKEGALDAGAALAAKDDPVPKKRIWIDHLPGMPKNTSEAHKDPQTGEYTPERKALHDKIIDAFLNGPHGLGKKRAKVVPSSKEPVSLFMLGTTASGKSTARDRVKPNPFEKHGAVIVDPDAIKQMLPEYQQSLDASARDAAKIVHDESSYIASKLSDAAMKSHKNVIIDGTGKSLDKMKQKISKARSSGYNINALMPHVPYDDCVERADQRAEEEGRYVPHEIIKECADKVGKNFMALQDQFDKFSLFDNRNRPKLPNGKWPPPVLIMKAPPRPPKVTNPKLFDVFKKENGLMESVRLFNPLVEVLGEQQELNRKPAAFNETQLAAWYMAAAQLEAERMEKLPRDFKVGEGIELPLND
jgi:predicted ABC-type ATPase